MNCPKCGLEMQDVRAEKTNPKSPDFKCSDPNCLNEKGYRTGAWLPKGKAVRSWSPPSPPQTGYAKEQAPKQPLTERPAQLRETGEALPWETDPRDERAVLLFWDCFEKVLEGIARRKLTDGFNSDNIAALTATLYIQRSKVG